MTSRKKTFANFKYDKRLLGINLKTGIVTREEYSSHLDKLPDLEGLAVPMTLAMNDSPTPVPAQAPVVESRDSGFHAPQTQNDYQSPVANPGFGVTPAVEPTPVETPSPTQSNSGFFGDDNNS